MEQKHSALPAPASQSGMGTTLHDNGVSFRVWAPHATAVSVIGMFNDWDKISNPMATEENGYWSVDVAQAKIGHEYRYYLTTPIGEISRMDPYAREVTSSVGNSVIHDPKFDWDEEYYKTPSWNEWVIYELHVGTFNDTNAENNQAAKFSDIIRRFDHLKKLGVNCLQIMPVAEFAGDRSWGYNPAHIFSVERTYGGSKGFKEFIKAAHKNGFAVILDVVYNHFGPSDLDIWRFDGWSENDGGGIYFYQDWRKHTPWADTRPDYGRDEVRQFIRDNALMWIEEYHCDGLRMDMTLYIRNVRPDGASHIPDGWSLLQWINSDIRKKHPNTLTIAEDLQKTDALTSSTEDGGAGFGSQWDDQFVHPIRASVITSNDEHRSMDDVAHAIIHRYNSDAFQRVIYSESHDEVANGRARVVHEIAPDDPHNIFAQRRSTLAAALVMTSPGIPMLFQGQEFMEGGWFRDTVPVDWDRQSEFRSIVKLYRDLIALRRNKFGTTRGLCGQHVDLTHVHHQQHMIAFRRWDEGGPGDDVLVVANFGASVKENYEIGFPNDGHWKVLFNSDSSNYSEQFTNTPSADLVPQGSSSKVTIGPYTVLIYAKVV